MTLSAHPELAVLRSDTDGRAARYLIHRLGNAVHGLNIQLSLAAANDRAPDPTVLAAHDAIARIRAVIAELRATIEEPQLLGALGHLARREGEG